MSYQSRALFNRVISFIRPKPQYLPLQVTQLKESPYANNLVEKFNDFYYTSWVGGDLNWKGLKMLKNPCDLWMVLELFQTLKPVCIIETGTHQGASALFYSDMLKTLNIDATVITIDINPKWSFDPLTKKIVSVVGFSTADDVAAQVAREVEKIQQKTPGHVLVMLDSDHSQSNVEKELNIYSKFVTKGSYLIVEDTNVNGHPSNIQHGPGPWEAVDGFLKTNDQFSVDENCQRFLLTFNPRGWLKRTK